MPPLVGILSVLSSAQSASTQHSTAMPPVFGNNCILHSRAPARYQAILFNLLRSFSVGPDMPLPRTPTPC
eukprot:6265902-Pyramimonas_sp.AAC.1